jgi:tetratricopeptide (TPR) repeat protein
MLSVVLCDLGQVARRQGNYAQGEVYFTEALDLTRATHDQLEIANVLELLGTLALHQQLPSRAVSLLEESVRLFRGQEVAFSLGWALIHLAEARRVARDPFAGGGSAEDDDVTIKQCWEEGLLILRDFQARQIVGQALLETGELAYEQGDDARAAHLLSDSLAAFQELGLVEDIVHVLDAIAALWVCSPAPAALDRAIGLWSAATKWHRNRPRLSPIRRSRYERTFASARSQLGEELFAAAWEEGQRLSLEQAVVYALALTSLQ